MLDVRVTRLKRDPAAEMLSPLPGWVPQDATLFRCTVRDLESGLKWGQLLPVSADMIRTHEGDIDEIVRQQSVRKAQRAWGRL